jgi:hypothetical protein
MDLTMSDCEVDPFEDLGVSGRHMEVLDSKEGSGLVHTPIVFALSP